MTTIVTLMMDAPSQEHFDALREAHYPARLNRIAAHLTLFHALPDTKDVRDALLSEAAAVPMFVVRVSGVMSLGRGVAYLLESAELKRLHKRLSTRFAKHLTAQDRQGFRPHVVVQNKVSSDEAKGLRVRLSAEFVPWEVKAEGLAWWNYLGGPWEIRERFGFGEDAGTTTLK